MGKLSLRRVTELAFHRGVVRPNLHLMEASPAVAMRLSLPRFPRRTHLRMPHERKTLP